MEYVESSNITVPMLIKDCDSYFNHQPIEDSYRCVQRIEQFDSRLSNKSFAVMEEVLIHNKTLFRQIYMRNGNYHGHRPVYEAVEKVWKSY